MSGSAAPSVPGVSSERPPSCGTGFRACALGVARRGQRQECLCHTGAWAEAACGASPCGTGFRACAHRCCAKGAEAGMPVPHGGRGQRQRVVPLRVAQAFEPVPPVLREGGTGRNACAARGRVAEAACVPLRVAQAFEPVPTGVARTGAQAGMPVPHGGYVARRRCPSQSERGDLLLPGLFHTRSSVKHFAPDRFKRRV
jgi:hypothetical protein